MASTIIRAHKIRLHPTPEQEDYLRRAAGTRRFVYNWLRREVACVAVGAT
jgi:putative transposase